MKLALEDQVWKRLYGPYGNRSVNTLLTQLSTRWDTALAKELFWEELHHQDDIYPVTFAALPWLSDISPPDGEGFEETQLFLSHVIRCANLSDGTGYDGSGPRRKYRGLSNRISDHHLSWIPEDEWLRDEDQPVLLGLEDWFSENCASLAEMCLVLVSTDLSVAAYALEGFATLKGSERVAFSVQMLADGEDMQFIHKELGDYDTNDSHVVGLLYPLIQQRSPQIASFVLNYPGCTHVPEHSRQNRPF
ncbi:hypothetical protein IWQ51_006815 [Labrenzia sp. EL_142]|nr:hypothetical protein [Labrenzia sp. EL_142]